jgi:hypothetical protein
VKDWKSRLPDLIGRTDKLSDSVRSRLKKITGFNGPLMIIPHLGYGTADKLSFGGRILEDEGFTPAASADRTWRNLINMYKRFETDEVRELEYALASRESKARSSQITRAILVSRFNQSRT